MIHVRMRGCIDGTCFDSRWCGQASVTKGDSVSLPRPISACSRSLGSVGGVLSSGAWNLAVVVAVDSQQFQTTFVIAAAEPHSRPLQKNGGTISHCLFGLFPFSATVIFY
ncbi:unnamed protein product [[Candida] boidinii]|nr:unnamed protein product [[Candida] boidinii]GMF53456.1 unnamed protein product [[Candida] boidinii]